LTETFNKTHRSQTVHVGINSTQHPPNIVALVQERVPFRKGHHAHDVERVELHPLGEVKNLAMLKVALVYIVHETVKNGVEQGLKGHRVRCREVLRHGAFDLLEFIFVGRVEDRDDAAMGRVGFEDVVERSLEDN